MKKISSIFVFLLSLSLSLSATIAHDIKKILPQGDHSLIKDKSSDDCMDGSITYIEYEEKGKTHHSLLISSRVGFSIHAKDLQEQENVENGCDYKIRTSLSDKGIKRETIRSNCPAEAENTTVVEEVSVHKEGYSYILQDLKNKKRECHYSFAKGDSL